MNKHLCLHHTFSTNRTLADLTIVFNAKLSTCVAKWPKLTPLFTLYPIDNGPKAVHRTLSSLIILHNSFVIIIQGIFFHTHCGRSRLACLPFPMDAFSLNFSVRSNKRQHRLKGTPSGLPGLCSLKQMREI